MIVNTENVEREHNSGKPSLYAVRFREIVALEKLDSRIVRPCLSCAVRFRPSRRTGGCDWVFCSDHCEAVWLNEVLKDCSGTWVQEHLELVIDRYSRGRRADNPNSDIR